MVTGIQLQFLNFNFKIILRKINFFVLLPPYHFTNDSTKNQYKIFHYLQLNATHTQTPYSTLSSQQQNHAPQPSRPTNQSKKKKKKKKKHSSSATIYPQKRCCFPEGRAGGGEGRNKETKKKRHDSNFRVVERRKESRTVPVSSMPRTGEKCR